MGDGERHGGYYTREEVREIVEYAAERYVTIVPEIEMPGHSLAALAAYPELACTERPVEVATTWGVFEDIYCPKEETFEFLENVLAEVIELFPGEYIHIGGDEAPKERWEESEAAQEVMSREGLEDEEELQSWFIRRIERFLNERGRRLIGWDEILEGGLAPDATVMSWRGVEGGIEAARQGHDVIMTPTSHLYFDYYQGDAESEPLAIGGFLPLETVYSFEPVPEELTGDEAEHVEYMVLPRMLALSEITWSPAESRTFEGFLDRLPPHLARLDALGYDFRIPEVRGLEQDRLVLGDTAVVRLEAPVPGGGIEYRVMRSGVPGPQARTVPERREYTGPFPIDLSPGPVTIAAQAVMPDGEVGPVREASWERTTLRPAEMSRAEAIAAGLTWGLRVTLHEDSYRSVRQIAEIEPTRIATLQGISLPDWTLTERYGLRFSGYLEMREAGVYTFRLTSDDGSVLRIGGETVIDHDGPHGAVTREGQVALGAGMHRFELDYFQAGGGAALELKMGRADGVQGSVPGSRFWR